MGKEIVVDTYNKIVSSPEKEGKPTICGNKDETTWGHCAEWNKPVREGQILLDSTYVKDLK